METQPPVQQLRTPMDPLVSFASSLFSAFSPLLSSAAAAAQQQQQQGSTFLFLPLPVAAARALTVLRRRLLLATQAFIYLLFMFLSALAPAPPPQPSALLAPTLPRLELGSPAGDTCVGRALAHVLSLASRLPVASRKYALVRPRGAAARRQRARGRPAGRCREPGRARRRVRAHATVAGVGGGRGRVAGGGAGRARGEDGDAVVDEAGRGGVLAGREVRRASGGEDGRRAAVARAEDDRVRRGARRRGAVRRSGQAREPRGRVRPASPVFLFKHASSKEFEQSAGGKEGKGAVAEQRIAMLRSWLPLLCRGSTGTDAPVLTGRERAEMVTVLEDLIDKLSWEQREEALSLWLHHFAACPDTDWPNLETCYTRWYAESSKLLA